ncbi:hypothetical protein Bhyg_09115 [Pseudolycoriella hygida]|uniref:Heme oxygenase n=1 Tax=Pseudolycoriella hygida TaxID=35572 RepID=A0A9Q0N5X5_9DIPT|nr:hypothetical protein Bhyg_09115 [Pseudolycoriella hygida]
MVDAVTMRDVQAAISEKVRQMVANNILFKFLNDESLSATERLRRIAPPFSYFVLAFHDLQAHVLKYPDEEAETDHIKAAINAHCAEDSTHWPMFVTDLKTLRVDKETSYTSAIKHLWGKRTRRQRYSCYDLAMLAHDSSDPILRFANILSFEITGHAFFGECLELAERSEAETGKELLYFGRTHFLRETGGLHGQEDAENELLEMELSPEMRTKALEIAMKQLKIQDAQWGDIAMAAFANEKCEL